MANGDVNEPRLFTVREVAQRFSVHKSTVDRWISDGKLSSVKIGRNRRVSPDQLDAFVREHRDGDR